MTTPRKPRDILAELLGEPDGEAMTKEEIAAELAGARVDVPAFLAKVRARVKEVDEAERLAWKEAARKKLASRRTISTGKYEHSDRETLLAEIARRQARSDQTRAYFHKLEELADEDLRTWLEDDDSLDEPEDDGNST